MTDPILQIHVTRKCNLTCLHCYSKSGPDQSEHLSIEDLIPALKDAKALGYGMISVSGGEPFLYPELPQLLAAAKAEGLRTAAVTNGMYLDDNRLKGLHKNLDVVAVSMDGAPSRHNHMRANARAFEVMAKKLPNLAKSGIPFGILMTLTADNISEIDWVADFAADNGAHFLQIFPLEMEGRAKETAHAESTPDSTDALRAARAAQSTQDRLAGRLPVRLGYQMSARLGASEGTCGRRPTFADRVNPLTIEPDGRIVPMGHGFANAFMLGRLGAAPLTNLAETWDKDGRGAAYANLVHEATTDAVSAAETAPLVDFAHQMRALGQQSVQARS